MNIGKRLRNIRNHRNLTQQALGEKLGIDEKSAGVRVIQYEKGLRTPRKEYIEKFSEVLNVMPEAINVPTINDSTGLMHLLFALEEFFDLRITELDNKVCLTFGKEVVEPLLSEWYEKNKSFQNGDISENEYKDWQYNYKRK